MSVSKEVALVDSIETMDKLANLWLKGERNPTAIARQLQMKRADVLNLIDDFKQIVANDEEVKGRAKEALFEADKSLDLVVKRSWETVEQADDAGDLKTKATVLKNIADVEGKRVDMLQKAGLYDDAALGDELAEMEAKADAIKGLLKEVAAVHPQARLMIMQGLQKIFGQPEGITVVEGELAPSA